MIFRNHYVNHYVKVFEKHLVFQILGKPQLLTFWYLFD